MNFEVTSDAKIRITSEGTGSNITIIVSPEYGQALVDIFQGAVNSAAEYHEVLIIAEKEGNHD